jgi:hypothetical protein
MTKFYVKCGPCDVGHLPFLSYYFVLDRTVLSLDQSLRMLCVYALEDGKDRKQWRNETIQTYCKVAANTEATEPNDPNG